MTNPILPGFHPDPSWCRVGDEYFMATSTFTWLPGVPIYRSSDRQNWTHIGHALDRASQISLDGTEAWASFGVFAPTLRHHDGRFWMITTSVSLDGVHSFLVTAEDPAGPWSDPVSIGIDGIDPDIAWDEDGNCWVHYSGIGTGIMRCRIDEADGTLLDEPVPTWSGSGFQHPEAPHLYRIRDRWYLMIAEGGTGAGHCVSIARGPSPEGPWESSPENPILSHRSTDHPIQNTGHADLVEDDTGAWWMALLGVRSKGSPAGFHVLGRESFLTSVVWDDGWPVVTSPNLDRTQPAHEFVDTFASDRLDLGWISRRRYPADVADLAARPGSLTLTADGTDLGSPRPAFVGRRQQHPFCTAETEVDLLAGEEAGLAVVYDEQSYCRVGIDAETVFATALIGGMQVELGRSRRPDGPTRLRVQVVEGGPGPDQLELAWLDSDGELGSLGTLDGRYLSTEVSGGFLGRIIGLYAAHGTAAFDYFRYAAM